MDETTLAILLFVLCYIIGLAGVVLPVVPGVPLIALGALGAGLLTDFQLISLRAVVWTAALAVLAQIMEYVTTIIGARYYGARAAGLWGGIAGALIGVIAAPPLGFLFGALIGAIAAELMTGRDFAEAVRAGLGALIGAVGSIAVKLIIVVIIGFMIFPGFF